MGFIRPFIIIMVIYLVWRLIKTRKAKLSAKKKTTVNDSKTMVKCEQCGTHLPSEQALQANNFWFCDQQHFDSFQNR